MRTKKLGANASLLETNHGDEILYSFDKAVAGFSAIAGYFKTNEECTPATQKHIDKYLKNVVHVEELNSKQIEEMFL